MLQCIRNAQCISLGGKKTAQIFFFAFRVEMRAYVSFVFVLTLSGFRKIVGTQRQKIDAHSLGENA